MSVIDRPFSDVRRAAGVTRIDPSDLPSPGFFINGEVRQTPARKLLDVVNPADEKVIAGVPMGTAADVDLAVSAAVKAKGTWGRRVPKDRSEVLHAIADRVAENYDLFVRLESANTGKPISVARDDVDATMDTFRFMAGALRSTTSLAAGDYVQGHLSVILREPLGVVGVVTPWNYPLLTAAQKIAPILAVGNTMVLKPSEQTPLTTMKLVELVADLLPAGVLNVVTGTGPVVGAALAAHRDVDMISLTGSVGAGRAVARAAAESLKRVHLELGGKAPVVVFEDADLDLVATTLRTASFYNSGQDCGAAARVLVDASIADQLVDLLAAQVSEIIVGEPGAGDDIEIGPLVSQEHSQRVLEHLDRAFSEGARAAVGGARIEGTGYFVEPTVLVDVSAGSACTRDEIFGPVVTVETFSSEAEAVQRANDVPLGLSASLWTNDARRSHDVAARIDAGTVWVNCHSSVSNEMPWGGFKGSGYGRDLSLYALDDYSRTKHVVHNHER